MDTNRNEWGMGALAVVRVAARIDPFLRVAQQLFVSCLFVSIRGFCFQCNERAY
jgi:hypothetical protein